MAQRQNKSKQSKGKKGRKFGRKERKLAARNKPLSLYIRGKITAAAYFASKH